MTTVLVSTPGARLDLFTLMTDWLNPNDAVYPYDAVYAPDLDQEENREEGQVEMVTSQDSAAAAALRELGYDVTPVIEVVAVTDGTPAAGKLKVRDVLLEVGGIPIKSGRGRREGRHRGREGRADRVQGHARRQGRQDRRDLDHADHDRRRPARGHPDRHRFRAALRGRRSTSATSIGGPSAGLMFSLAIFDTLTPGSLTGGQVVAGTGTIDEQGKVGPIGGIQQKIVGAREDGAQLFLVPPDNCADALGARNGDMRLVKAVTMHAAVQAIEKWVKDPDAKLPACAATTERKADG